MTNSHKFHQNDMKYLHLISSSQHRQSLKSLMGNSHKQVLIKFQPENINSDENLNCFFQKATFSNFLNSKSDKEQEEEQQQQNEQETIQIKLTINNPKKASSNSTFRLQVESDIFIPTKNVTKFPKMDKITSTEFKINNEQFFKFSHKIKVSKSVINSKKEIHFSIILQKMKKNEKKTIKTKLLAGIVFLNENGTHREEFSFVQKELLMRKQLGVNCEIEKLVGNDSKIRPFVINM